MLQTWKVVLKFCLILTSQRFSSSNHSKQTILSLLFNMSSIYKKNLVLPNILNFCYRRIPIIDFWSLEVILSYFEFEIDFYNTYLYLDHSLYLKEWDMHRYYNGIEVFYFKNSSLSYWLLYSSYIITTHNQYFRSH